MKLLAVALTLFIVSTSALAQEKVTRPEDMKEVTVNGFELSGGEYWVFTAEKEFSYPDDVLWGLQGQWNNDETDSQGAPVKALACGLQAYNKLMDFYANPPEGMKKLIEVGKTTNRFFLWVNDYTTASDTEEVRENSFWHWNRGEKDYSKGYFKWESTLTKDGQCLLPDDAQILETIKDISKKLKI